VNKSLVSIITAVYNNEHFIDVAIRSVLEQTYDHWEHIIINDGSTDRSEQKINEFRDERIKYFYQENKGVSSARNTGLERMNGDYFCFLDADDYLPPDSLKNRLKIFEKDAAVRFVDGKINIYDRNLNILKSVWSPEFRGNPISELLSISGSCFFGPSWMIRRNNTLDYRFHEDLTHGEDLLFFIEAAAGGGLYDFTDEVILHYRKGHPSAMKNLGGLEEGYHYIYRQLQGMGVTEEKTGKFRKKARNILFRSYLGHFHPVHAFMSQIRKW
jgi:teichuronic acid biosynthesis glycosyltransferase TuaG